MRSTNCWATVQGMKILVVFPSLLVLAAAVHDLEVQGSSVNVTAVNAFPDVNASAFVVFEHTRISRLPYGGSATRKLSPEDVSDFIIEFKQGITETLIPGYTQYGYIGSEFGSNSAVLLVVSRDHASTVSRPKHRTITFPVSPHDSSKLYVYNAIWNKASPDKRINVYALYKRTNYDGSESESMMLLAGDVPENQGRELAVQPGTRMTLKAFYHPVKSVPEFLQHPHPVATLDWFTVPEGKHSYVVMHGTYREHTTPPKMLLIGGISSATTHTLSTVTVSIVTLVATLMFIIL